MTEVVARRIWRAMQLKDAGRSVIAAPFLVDPYEENEEPEEAADGCITLVEFPFSLEDYAIVQSLQVKQTEYQFSHSMKIGQMFLEKKVSDLFAEILEDYAQTALHGYQISHELKLKANDILQTDWRSYD